MNDLHMKQLAKLRQDENFSTLTPRMLLFEAIRKSSVVEVSRELGSLIAEITVVQRIARSIEDGKKTHAASGSNNDDDGVRDD